MEGRDLGPDLLQNGEGLFLWLSLVRKEPCVPGIGGLVSVDVFCMSWNENSIGS